MEPEAGDSLPVESESLEPAAAEDEGLAPAGAPVLAESEAEEPLPPEDEDESDEAPPVDEGTIGAGSTTVKAAVTGDDTASWPRPVGVRMHEAAPSTALAATVSATDGPLTAPATRVTMEVDALTPAEHSIVRSTSTAAATVGVTMSTTDLPWATLLTPSASAAAKPMGAPTMKVVGAIAW